MATPGRQVFRVLFVGNSYTRFHDMPSMVSRLGDADSGAHRIDAVSEARGGYSLRRHWQRGEAQRRIAEGGFDAVVLQGHSLGPLRTPRELVTYARRFDAEVRDFGARLVLFETWARGPGSTLYGQEPGLDARAMESELNRFYRGLAALLGATLAPVGEAWAEAQRRHPGITLHRGDGAHPDLAGSYLAAAVMYGALTGRDPRRARWQPVSLHPGVATQLRAVAASALGQAGTRTAPGGYAFGGG